MIRVLFRVIALVVIVFFHRCLTGRIDDLAILCFFGMVAGVVSGISGWYTSVFAKTFLWPTEMQKIAATGEACLIGMIAPAIAALILAVFKFPRVLEWCIKKLSVSESELNEALNELSVVSKPLNSIARFLTIEIKVPASKPSSERLYSKWFWPVFFSAPFVLLFIILGALMFLNPNESSEEAREARLVDNMSQGVDWSPVVVKALGGARFDLNSAWNGKGLQYTLRVSKPRLMAEMIRDNPSETFTLEFFSIEDKKSLLSIKIPFASLIEEAKEVLAGSGKSSLSPPKKLTIYGTAPCSRQLFESIYAGSGTHTGWRMSWTSPIRR